MALVVHPHFHKRRSGATTHVEAVVPALDQSLETRAIGSALEASVPTLRWSELLQRLRRESVIWHAHRNHELLIGWLLRPWARDLKLVFTRHSSTPAGAFTRFLAKRSHGVISLTGQVARELGVPSVIVPHGVDTRRFSPPGDRRSAWEHLGLSGEYGIGVVGRIRPDKGQGDFAKALEPLLPKHPNWRAALVGLVKSENEAWAKTLVQSLGEKLQLVGEKRDIVPWYQGFTILVHPSYQEAHSLVLLEALASGCCVVATRLEHHPEIIDHGRTGFLYDVGDVDELRCILGELMDNPQRAEQVGLAAAEDVARRYSLAREVSELLSLYRRVAEKS